MGVIDIVNGSSTSAMIMSKRNLDPFFSSPSQRLHECRIDVTNLVEAQLRSTMHNDAEAL